MKSDTDKKTIPDDVVKHVALLSRLCLNEKDLSMFREQLSSILKYIEQLDEVDTTGILPTTHVLASMKNVFREDVPGETFSSEKALKNAPVKKKSFFQVPKVI